MPIDRSASPAVLAVAFSVLLAPASAFAQSVEAGAPRTYALSADEKARLLDAGTEASAEAARAGLPGGGAGRQIHGEVGAMIGTNGARGAYGVAAIPLGDDAGAIVSFESSRFGNQRRR